ncbi:MAG: undecaprenyl-diphosphate phosphatase [Candidatus Omnitrophica bacterium]|nr:undecaprenyl-diphosphate phosphatase [Candidatus Omnitrophota bacterium]
MTAVPGPIHAVILGAVEGLTEFLPVSSTGHLILVSRVLRLQGAAVDTFDVVIQAGALVAVVGLYRRHVMAMGRGLLGRDAEGQALLIKVLISFLPAAMAGAALHHAIKAHLFHPGAVIAAMALGGLLMIAVDRWCRPQRIASPRTMMSLTRHQALIIGIAQCAALWPGTSRSMATILAGIMVGLPLAAAAEYSFLLALPTLGAATLFDAVKGGATLWQQIGGLSILVGFVSAAIVAAVAVRGFVQYVSRHGLALFGWYRVFVAAVVWVYGR